MPNDLNQRLEEIIQNTEPGGRLLSEPKLAKQLGVSRATLREAMRTFETQGWIRRQQGVGTFALHPSQIIDSGLEMLESIEKLAERTGLTVTMGELVIENQVADGKISEALQLSIGSAVLRVSRVILTEDRPVAYLVDVLPEAVLSSADVNGGFTGSVLDLLLRRGDPVLGTSYCEINAVVAEKEVPRALNIQRGTALIRLESILYSQDGKPVDYSLSYFLPGYFKFHVVRRVGS
jgi:GntR family transcriptional regulator